MVSGSLFDAVFDRRSRGRRILQEDTVFTTVAWYSDYRARNAHERYGVCMARPLSAILNMRAYRVSGKRVAFVRQRVNVPGVARGRVKNVMMNDVQRYLSTYSADYGNVAENVGFSFHTGWSLSLREMLKMVVSRRLVVCRVRTRNVIHADPVRGVSR